ncbi:MAG: RNA-binding S4 domain-containing protein [Clostridia bacterium]|nr:RNA-binding S4 domain-containing protein [Clostridia bacterium]
MTKIYIHTPFIKLKDALKFAGAVESGAVAKIAVLEGKVKVNGEICTVSGKKMVVGDIIEYDSVTYEVTHDFSTK